MKEILLFTDGSVNVQTKIGYGAALVLEDIEQSLEATKKLVQIKQFENTSSTKLELETLLWALNDIKTFEEKVIIYTDSQNIVSLPGRRERLEKNSYRSKKNERIKNFELYQKFYQITDLLDCELIKVSGHQQSSKKEKIDKIFTLVDRASRSALRKDSKK